MDNKYFKLPEDSDLLRGVDSEDKYFQEAGDLDVDASENENKYFRPLGNHDLTTIDKHFKPAGDLDAFAKKINTSLSSLEEINNYLLKVVSGKRYEPVCELGVLMGGGRMVVDLEQLQNLVDTGHNIVFANVINADRGLIEVEVQKYVYDKEKMERRSRF